MKRAWMMALLLLPTASAMLPAPALPEAQRGGGACADTPLWVDPCGDTMTGDLRFQPLTNVVLDSRATVTFPAGSLAGELGPGLTFDGAPVCLAGAVQEGCIAGVVAGDGLAGGGSSGTPALHVKPGGIKSVHIAPSAVGAAQVNPLEVQLRLDTWCPYAHAISHVAEDGKVFCTALSEAVGHALVKYGGKSYFGSGRVTTNSVSVDCPVPTMEVVVSGSAYVENLGAAGGTRRFEARLWSAGGLQSPGFRAVAHVSPGEGQMLSWTFIVQCKLGPLELTQDIGPATGTADFRVEAASLTAHRASSGFMQYVYD